MRHYIYFLTLFIGVNSWAQFGSISSQYCIYSTESDIPIKEALLENGNRIILLLSNSDAYYDKTENARGEHDFWVLCFDPNDQIVWQKTIGGIGFDLPSGLLITEDQSIYICGSTLSPPSFEQTNELYGDTDAWLIKMNSTGTILWNKNYGGAQDDDFNDLIELPSGNILTFGVSYSGVSGNKTSTNYGWSDIWIMKLSPNGEIINDLSIGGEDHELKPIVIQTAPNQIKLAAFSYSDISGLKTEPSYGSSDIWVLDLDTNCNLLQQKSIGGSADDRPSDLLMNINGDLLILAESTSNQSGLKTENSFGETDSWILKLDDQLNIIQQKTVGSDLQDFGGQFIEWPNGNICVAVNSFSNTNVFKSAPRIGATDIWMFALDGNLNFLTDKTLGTNQFEFLATLRLNPNLTDIHLLVGTTGSDSNDKTCMNYGDEDLWGFTVNSTLEVKEIQTSPAIKVYPNPSTGVFSFEGLADLSGQLRIQVSNTYGQIVWEESITDANQQFTIERPGLYLVSILKNDQLVQTVKLLRY